MTLVETPLTRYTPEMVMEAKDPAVAFVSYAQQEMGCWGNYKDVMMLRKKAKLFFEMKPGANWLTLCKVVVWAKDRRKRFSRVWMFVEAANEAWAAGRLPELDPKTRDEQVEEQIQRALAEETRPAWRVRLLGAAGLEARETALIEWQQSLQEA